MEQLTELVRRARGGDLDAFGRLVVATQRMAYAVAKSVVRDPALAEDAMQDAYLRAFRRLGDLEEVVRKEIEVTEQRAIHPDEVRPGLPARVLELLARPRLTDLPETRSARCSTS